jgi:hypothetical protein
VLFADLKDSTELIRGLDPEAAQQLLDPAIHRMMGAVHRFEGTVNQVLGDGVMALFGAPIAHEDHALRACYAALAMQAAMRATTEEVRRTRGLELRMRVGLNSGESGSLSPPGRLAPAAGGDAAGGGGNLLSSSSGHRSPPAGQVAGAAGRYESEQPMAAAGQARRSAPAARAGLRLVHRGLRHR